MKNLLVRYKAKDLRRQSFRTIEAYQQYLLKIRNAVDQELEQLEDSQPAKRVVHEHHHYVSGRGLVDAVLGLSALLFFICLLHIWVVIISRSPVLVMPSAQTEVER